MNESNLAVLGGTPVRQNAYPARSCFDDEERSAALRALDSGVLSGFVGTPGEHHYGGPEVRALETCWRGLGGYRDVVSVNSATAALHAGVVAMELPAGSEVVVPPFTMSATVAAVRMAGLRPRFADVDQDLFTLTATTIEPVLGSRTVAILPVHLFGQMAPMAPIQQLCDRQGLRILEDNAQAPGATQNGRWPGHGTAGAIFSFNQNKVITCGEGGLLASDDPAVIVRAQLIRNHAESVVHAYPEVRAEGMVGWNYRLTELSAAVARAQTDKLSRLNAGRVRLAERLRNHCANIEGLVPPLAFPGNTHVYFTFAIRFLPEAWGCDRQTFVTALRAEGIPCAAGYVPPLYRLAMLGPPEDDPTRDPANFPVCERLAREELVLLPVCQFPATDDDIDMVGEALAKCWAGRGQLSRLTAVSN
jgi:dTDP-4-amino-4,6-dideoxygalactose transaminase